MPKTLRLQATVMPGGKVEIVDQNLTEGETVDVAVTRSLPTERRSPMDVFAESPGHRLFKTAQEVNDYLEAERAS